ncbi:MAG: hypothetical protein J6D02_10610 [Lachnospira sp.]|nr:hypothetical protein [Lachnospira sp.]
MKSIGNLQCITIGELSQICHDTVIGFAGHFLTIPADVGVSFAVKGKAADTAGAKLHERLLSNEINN